MSIINRSFTACTGIFAAALFVGVSASQNVLNGRQLGLATSELHATIFAAGSLAGAICQPVGWYAAWRSFQQGHCGRDVIAAFLASACLLYAALSSLAFVSTARTDGVAARTKAADTYQLANERAAVALIELKTINSAPRGNRRDELRKAERRASLELSIADAEKTLHGDSAPAAGDPAAASLAAYASALGWQLSPQKISPWITIAVVIFFEVGAGLSLIVVKIVAAPEISAAVVQNSATNSNDVAEGESEAEPEPTPPGRPRGRPRAATPDSVISRIRSNGGALSGNLHSIGRVIGLPAKSSAHRVLRELEAAGRVRIETTPDGTIVRLAS